MDSVKSPYEIMGSWICVTVSEGAYVVASYEEIQRHIDSASANNDEACWKLWNGAMELLRDNIPVGYVEDAYTVRQAERLLDQWRYAADVQTEWARMGCKGGAL